MTTYIRHKRVVFTLSIENIENTLPKTTDEYIFVTDLCNREIDKEKNTQLINVSLNCQ